MPQYPEEEGLPEGKCLSPELESLFLFVVNQKPFTPGHVPPWPSPLKLSI